MPSARPSLPLLLALLLPLGASAFSVPAHEALTRASVDATVQAGAHPALAAHREAVVEGSRSEDLNLHVKWTGYHHFFHPGRNLDSTFRKDSGTRVRVLWAEAEEAASHGDLARAFDRVGHLVHHIQDMAVPLHVVPVMHGLSDHFEQHASHTAMVQLSGRELAPLSGEEAQLALARETLAVVREGTLPVEGGAIPWSAFWAAPTQDSFGTYGEVGNAFGNARVRWRGRTWKVETSSYEDFVDARAESAVAYTRAFLLWATERLTSLAQAQAHQEKRWTPSPELAVELLGGAITASRGITPVAGARALFPLFWSMKLSLGYAHALGNPLTGGRGATWSLALLSPPLLTARLGPSGGLDLRATAGAGLFSRNGTTHPELPVGLRLHTLLGRRFSLSAEAQYRAFAPATSPWAQGVSFTLGTGFTWGDR